MPKQRAEPAQSNVMQKNNTKQQVVPIDLEQLLKHLLDAEDFSANTLTSFERAERFYDGHEELFPLFRLWNLDRLARMFRAKNSPAPDEQLPLPGFESLPSRVQSYSQKRRGKRRYRSLSEATYSDLVLLRTRLSERFKNSKRLQQVETLMELLKPMPRGTTVKEALESAPGFTGSFE